MDTLISGVTVVTMNEKMDVLFGAYIAIEDGKISYIGKTAPEGTPATIILILRFTIPFSRSR